MLTNFRYGELTEYDHYSHANKFLEASKDNISLAKLSLNTFHSK
jgi:hypothetical protein